MSHTVTVGTQRLTWPTASEALERALQLAGPQRAQFVSALRVVDPMLGEYVATLLEWHRVVATPRFPPD